MKRPISSLFGLAIVTVAAFPAYVMAAPTDNNSAYFKDVANSYVQDQTSQVMSSLNNILCYMGGMAPNLMVNGGNYIALIDQNTCESRGSGGQSGNTGPAYTAVVVNSTRGSANTDPMLVKAWVEPQPGNSITVYASASEAPNTTSLPYGVFRMDFCGGGSPCASDKGFIDASSTGLSFYSAGTYGSRSETTQLQLSASSGTNSGSGVINESQSWTSPSVGSSSSNFAFAYNTNYFIRTDETGANPQCFDRTGSNADESVWRYGLYDGTGARVTRKSGFPIEYTTGGITYNGYVGYYGLWMPVTVASGVTVNQVSYDTNPPTKTAYTLLKTGGKLSKFTTVTKTLAALNKVTFWYYAPTNIAVTGGSISSMTPGQYEIYWDETAQQFKVSGMQNTTTFNMEPLATVGSIDNAVMAAAHSWGLFGWSQMLGGQFGIKGTEFAKLTSIPATLTGADVNVVTQIQDVVYPDQYASIGSLTCINDCPTAALISTSDAGTGTPYSNQGWTPVTSAAFVSYSLNGTTGNLIDVTPAAVVSTATSGTNANGVRSGRLVTTTDAATIITRKNAACSNCDSFNQGDVDLLDEGSSYYVWETGANPWNQIAILMNGATPVQFEAPLQVSFTVPVASKYGSYAGATMSLQYGGFGDLWGIPNECIDVTTNAECNFSTTAQENQRWTSKFSIPFNTTDGVVTRTVGAVTTTYFVKALDKEVRLKNVTNDASPNACALAGLTTPAVSTLALATNFVDPTSIVGTKPVVTDAPKVIHGVKQY